MRRTVHLILPILIAFFAGCRAYPDSVPRQIIDGDHPANFTRIFGTPIPPDVTVVNSFVAIYEFRTGVITTDDFEFELIVPPRWIQTVSELFYLKRRDDGLTQMELQDRRKRAHPWYAPGPMDRYYLYRDLTSAGYVHMLVKKEMENNGRHRLFISKH